MAYSSKGRYEQLAIFLIDCSVDTTPPTEVEVEEGKEEEEEEEVEEEEEGEDRDKSIRRALSDFPTLLHRSKDTIWRGRGREERRGCGATMGRLSS